MNFSVLNVLDMSTIRNTFSITRVASITGGVAKKQIPISSDSALARSTLTRESWAKRRPHHPHTTTPIHKHTEILPFRSFHHQTISRQSTR